MKLNEQNARFAVVGTAFHNGGTYSFHNSLEAALREKHKHQSDTCKCGCADVVPVTEEARKEYMNARDTWNNPIYSGYAAPALYADLPEWEPGKFSPYQLCK